MDGNCLYKSMLSQIACDKMYDEDHLRKHIAHYLSEYIEVFFPHFSMWLQDESFESYIRNCFDGRSYADDSIVSVIAVMWNLQITIISPHLPSQHIFHDCS